MHFSINICRCCLKSSALLRKCSIKNEVEPENSTNYNQKIQYIYPDLKLNKNLPFLLCYECQRLIFEATKLKQYLKLQMENVQCQMQLMKENTCSGCLEKSIFLTNQIEMDLNLIDIYNKNYIDVIRDVLPKYKVDSNVSYKYCQSCRNFSKSLYLLKTLLIKNNSLYEKYCATLLNNTDLHNPKFSQILITLQRTAIHYSKFDSEGSSIKEEIVPDKNSITFKIEIDEDNFNNITDTQPKYQLSGETLKQERELDDSDSYNIKNISYENNFPQDSSIFETNNQVCSAPRHYQISNEENQCNNNYCLNSSNGGSSIKEENIPVNNSITFKIEIDEDNFNNITDTKPKYQLSGETLKQERELDDSDCYIIENISYENNFPQDSSIFETNNQVSSAPRHYQISNEENQCNNDYCLNSSNGGSSIKEENIPDKTSITFKIEIDEHNFNNITDTKPKYQLSGETLKQERELDDSDSYIKNINYENSFPQDSSIFETNNQVCSAPRHYQISNEENRCNNNYCLNSSNGGSSIKEENIPVNNSITFKIEIDEHNFNNITDTKPKYQLSGETLKQERELDDSDCYIIENICYENNFPQDSSIFKTNHQVYSIPQHNQISNEENQCNNDYCLNSSNGRSSIKEKSVPDNNLITFNIEIDEDNFNNITDTRPKYQLSGGTLIQERDLDDSDCYIIENICNENNFSQDSTFIEINNQVCSVPRQYQISNEENQCNNNYCLNSSYEKSNLQNDKIIYPQNKPYNCNYCSRTFSLQSQLKKHDRIHTGEKPYKCSIINCSKSFTQKDHLKRHERIHTGEKPYGCKNCSYSFSTQYQLNQHERVHTGEKPYKCNYCSKCFARKSGLILHERRHTGKKPYACNFCSKSFFSSSNLKQHEIVHTRRKTFKCNYCSQYFGTNLQLIEHEKTHIVEKYYRCKYCSKLFRFNSALITHTKIHTGETPYKCNYCSKSFGTQDQLKQHEIIHNSEKTYMCDYCLQYFGTNLQLMEHEKIHNVKNYYRCKYCSKLFRFKSTLITHTRIHTGEKPFKCNYCSKSFGRQFQLKQHERIHTGEKPYKCNYCSFCFAHKNYLKRHEKTHTGK